MCAVHGAVCGLSVRAPEQSDAQQGGVSPPLPRLLFTRLFLPNWLTLVVFYDISRIYVCLLDGLCARLCTQIYLPLFAIFHIHLSLNFPALRYVKPVNLVFLGYVCWWFLDVEICVTQFYEIISLVFWRKTDICVACRPTLKSVRKLTRRIYKS